MYENYQGVSPQDGQPSGRLSGYSVNSPPPQRRSNSFRSSESEKANEENEERYNNMPSNEVAFRRIGGNRRARESFNRLSVEFDADAPEDAKTYTERFASAKALFENMTRSHMPSIESPNSKVAKVSRGIRTNSRPKVSPPVPIKPNYLATHTSDTSGPNTPTKTAEDSPVLVNSNLNRLLPGSPTKARLSQNESEGVDENLDSLGPRLSPEGQADPSTENGDSGDGIEPIINSPDAKPELEKSPAVLLETSGDTKVSSIDLGALHPEECQNQSAGLEPEPVVYSGTAEEQFVPTEAKKDSEQTTAEVENGALEEKVEDNEDTETEMGGDSDSVNEDEYDLGNEIVADYDLSSQAHAEEKQSEAGAEKEDQFQDARERDQNGETTLQNLEEANEDESDYVELVPEDEEVMMWKQVHQGLQDVDEIEGLPEAQEEDLYVADDEMTRKKKVVFSSSKIKVSYTYSLHDLDRRNDQIDPVGASAEYELEKRIDKMTLFEVELDKSNTGLGLSIIGMGVGADAGVEKLGIFIKTMNPNGAAAQSGKICVGDMIIEVNGQSLVGVTQVFAATVLKSTESVVKFLLGREQENGEISRLLHDAQAEEQAASAAQNVPHGMGNQGAHNRSGSGDYSEGYLNESVENLLPTTENFEKLKMMYQYSESTRVLFQEEREQALMQLDRIQAERDELGGRVIPRLEAQLASVQEELDQVQARRDELEKKYTKAKRLIKDLTSESNEMKEHVRAVKEQMNSMKEEFQQENFTLHEKIAILEAQLLQQQSSTPSPVGQPQLDQQTASGDTASTLDSNTANFTQESADEPFRVRLESTQAKDRHAELLVEARTRSSYVESQFNQVIQLLETPPRRFESRYDEGALSDDDLLENDRNSGGSFDGQNRRPVVSRDNNTPTNTPASGETQAPNRPVSSTSSVSYSEEGKLPHHNHPTGNAPLGMDNSDSSSNGSGSAGVHGNQRHHKSKGDQGVGNFHHEYQSSNSSSGRSLAEKLRSSFTNKGKYVVNTSPLYGSPNLTSSPHDIRPPSVTSPQTSPMSAMPSPLNSQLQANALHQNNRDSNYRSSCDVDGYDGIGGGFPRKESVDSLTSNDVSEISTSGNGGPCSAMRTDVKQMLLKLNLLKYYPHFQKYHIDGTNLHELASGDRLKEIGVVDRKDREQIKQHIKEMNRILQKDSKLKSKSGGGAVTTVSTKSKLNPSSK